MDRPTVFLCWSKARSREIAHAWESLLPTLVDVRAVMSTEFTKGRDWWTALRQTLGAARTGVVFLTPENVSSPWLHYEAGALATAMGERDGTLFTYVVGFDSGTLTGPLASYQSTVATREDTFRLIRDLCAATGRPAPSAEQFDAWWLKLAAKLDDVREPTIPELVPHFADWFERKTFLEPLPDCTNQRWLDRFSAARGVHAALQAASTQVLAHARPGARRVYQQLVAAVDSYAMAMSGFLVKEERFGFDDQGRLAAPQGAIRACEARRRAVNHLVASLADPTNATPVFETAIAFDEFDPGCRKSLIHRWEACLDNNDPMPVRGRWLPVALASEYAFDRIAAYVYQAKRQPTAATAALAAVWTEFERRRIEPDGTFMPLHYALRALSASPDLVSQPTAVVDKLQVLRRFLVESVGKGDDDPLIRSIETILARLAPTPRARVRGTRATTRMRRRG